MNGILARLLGLFRIRLIRNPFYDFLCIPDVFMGWIPHSVIKGFRLIRKYNIGMIYVSCTPFSAGIIGVFLRILTGKPLIVDFRDPYALEIESFRSLKSRPHLRKSIDRRIERMILKNADLLIIVTDELRDAYVRQYPEHKRKIRTVHNGFDAEILPTLRKLPRFDRFTIVYAGNYYFSDLDSDPFFEALALLKRKGQIDSEAFQFLYYGGQQEDIARIAREHGVERLTQVHSYVAYPKMLEIISRSHLLYVRALGGAFPTKISDGIALNTPLLAYLPPGEAQEIVLRYSPGSYIINENSPEKTAAAISDAIEKSLGGGFQDNDVKGFLAEFSRENLTLKLMSFIEQVL